jgi:DNA polymerase III epsilon subunit family exonuclease
MQLCLDAADRLVELVEERGGAVTVGEAARALFALRSAPDALARSLLDDVVSSDARLGWLGSAVGLTRTGEDPLLEEATFVVFDLETTGLGAADRICEIGAARIRALELEETFETLVNPRTPLPGAIAALTGIDAAELRCAPPASTAVRRFLGFAGDAVLVAHNARFDRGFLDRELQRSSGRRLARPVLDTVSLARRLLAGRELRISLRALASRFDTSVQPCHRALPDAQATAEILLVLIGLAQERGARTVNDLLALAAPRERRVHAKRHLARGAPARPGVYLFRGGRDEVLYVGRARDLRARLRSYFRSDRQRPAVEAALGAVERIEWRVLGSELEAGLEELRLIRELRPPANARQFRADRYVYLRRRGDGIVVSSSPTELGPIRSRRRAELAARALAGATDGELDGLLGPSGPLPRLRAKLRDLSDCLRYEDAARLRDRIAALERIVGDLRRLRRLRALETCLLVPGTEPATYRAVFVAAGRVCSLRTLGGGAELEVDAGLAATRAAKSAGVSLEPEHADELLLVASALARPAPELEQLPLSREVILGKCLRRAA